MRYIPVSPDQFTTEQSKFVDRLRDSIRIVSNSKNDILGAKDIHSRHIIATDAYSKIVSLKSGMEVENLLDCEMPCEGTAKFAESFVREDQSIIQAGERNSQITVLNIHEYGDGLAARIFSKHLMRHDDTQSILGITYFAHDINISNLFNVFDVYMKQFGKGCSIKLISNDIKLKNATLTNYEQVVCFLLLLKWDMKQVADFISRCRSSETMETYLTISTICEKAGLSSSHLYDLRDALISEGIHKSMPKSLFLSLLNT
jgi:AraC-like DNA-binding protein